MTRSLIAAATTCSTRQARESRRLPRSKCGKTSCATVSFVNRRRLGGYSALHVHLRVSDKYDSVRSLQRVGWLPDNAPVGWPGVNRGDEEATLLQ